MSRKTKIFIGQKFGRLEIISDSGNRDKKGGIIWECKCECGNVHFVNTSNLSYGSVKSCKCLAKELSSKRATELFIQVPKDCLIDGCNKPTNKGAWGYCGMHYQRVRRYGNPHHISDPRKRIMKKRFSEMQKKPAKEKTYHKFYGKHEHRVMAEEKEGRKLLPSEHAHHKDENRHNNKKENIEVMSAAEHARHHNKKHA